MRLNYKKFILLVLILGLSIVGWVWGLKSIKQKIYASPNNSQNFSYENEDPRKLLKNLFIAPLKGEDEGRINILLLGISGQAYIAGDLTDTIIFASINTNTKNVNLFSIPRDLWVKNTSGVFQKINALYKIDGGATRPSINSISIIREKVEEITGSQIHYSSVIDLDGIKEIVDLMGGVETEEGYKNGASALKYIRDRSRPGGDFDRMKRQQKLLIAIKKKIAEENTFGTLDQSKVLELYSSFQEHFASDAGTKEIIRFYELLQAITEDNIDLYTITSQNLLYSDYTKIGTQSAYTLHPKAGYEDYSEIQTFIKTILQ